VWGGVGEGGRSCGRLGHSQRHLACDARWFIDAASRLCRHGDAWRGGPDPITPRGLSDMA